MDKEINIILIDERQLVRYGLRCMLEQESDMKLVGDYASTEEALFEMSKLHKDVVLLSTQLPGMNVIETTRQLKRHGLNYGGDVIILAESMDYRDEALAAGATSYLLDDISYQELLKVIRQVYRSRQPIEDYHELLEEAIELVVPPPADAALLLHFMCHLGSMLYDHRANIICTVGSWDGGCVITIRTHPLTPFDLLDGLADMAEVEKVEEQPLAKGTFPGLIKKLRFQPRLRINPSKRVSVTLKETSPAKLEPFLGCSMNDEMFSKSNTGLAS